MVQGRSKTISSLYDSLITYTFMLEANNMFLAISVQNLTIVHQFEVDGIWYTLFVPFSEIIYSENSPLRFTFRIILFYGNLTGILGKESNFRNLVYDDKNAVSSPHYNYNTLVTDQEKQL